MMLSKRRAQTGECTDQSCLHVTGLFDLLTPLFSHDSSSPNHLYPSFFHTFGSFPENLISLVTMLRCSFPASHNASHPYRQWYPPQSVRCSPVDPWCWVSPLAQGLRLPWEGTGLMRFPHLPWCLCACVCVHTFDGLMAPAMSLAAARQAGFWAPSPATDPLHSFLGVQVSFYHIP